MKNRQIINFFVDKPYKDLEKYYWLSRNTGKIIAIFNSKKICLSDHATYIFPYDDI